MTTEPELREIARRRLKARADFIQFLLVWAAVSAIVVGVWAVIMPGTFFWPIFPIAGMGIAAMFMAIDAYGPNPKAITEADVDAEVARMMKGKS